MTKLFAWVAELLFSPVVNFAKNFTSGYNLAMNQFLIQNSDVIIKLVMAMGLGLLIGAERLFMHKEVSLKTHAGIKTHSLVSLGAAVFVIVSEAMVLKYGNLPGLNPTMIPSQIVVGIGFLGAGSIIFQDSRLIGLTTASGLWVTAGIGMATGFGFYSLAIIATILVLFVLIVVNLFERPLKQVYENEDKLE